MTGEPTKEHRTGRLRLRQWTAADREPFARLNADALVMKYFSTMLSRATSDALADVIEDHIAQHGWGLWAVEVPGVTPFAGFTGLWPATFEAHFTPAVEVGWRLTRSAWGHGYATEAALAALDYAFSVAELDEIVSMTAVTNVRSQRVMQRIGMTHDPADDFEHPNVPDGHRVKPHVLYRIRHP